MRKKNKLPQRIDAPVFSYWQALYMAFYSRRLYVDVAKRWRGVGFFYLWLMIAVASIPLCARLIFEYNLFIEDQIVAPLKQIPPLEIQHGEISLNKPMPYFVKSKTGAVVAMIDTRTKGKGMEGTYPELMLLVTKDKFYVRPPTINLLSIVPGKSEAQKQIIQMPDKNTFKILVMSEWLESSGILHLKWMGAALIYPFMVSFLFGFIFSFFLAFAMLAQVFSWLILRFKIRYAAAVRILIVSSTVQLSVLMVFFGANRIFPGLGLLSLILCVAYFSYAVLSVKRESLLLVRS